MNPVLRPGNPPSQRTSTADKFRWSTADEAMLGSARGGAEYHYDDGEYDF